MAQLLVRRLDDDLKARLKTRAAEHGVSMEEEARMILRSTLLPRDSPRKGLGTQIAELFRDIPDNDEPLPTIRWGPLKPVRFDE